MVAFASPKRSCLGWFGTEKHPRGRKKLLKQLNRKSRRSAGSILSAIWGKWNYQEGARFKRPSKRQLRLRNRRRKVYRSLSEERKESRTTRQPRIIMLASCIEIEEWVSRASETKPRHPHQSKTNRPYSRSVTEKPYLGRSTPWSRSWNKESTLYRIDVEVISPKDVLNI